MEKGNVCVGVCQVKWEKWSACASCPGLNSEEWQMGGNRTRPTTSKERHVTLVSKWVRSLLSLSLISSVFYVLPGKSCSLVQVNLERDNSLTNGNKDDSITPVCLLRFSFLSLIIFSLHFHTFNSRHRSLSLQWYVFDEGNVVCYCVLLYVYVYFCVGGQLFFVKVGGKLVKISPTLTVEDFLLE